MPLKLKNFSMEQFNRDVNASHDPDASYIRWAAYRSEIGGLLGGIFGNSIVLGAGALNDVDLPLLCGASKRVVLADIDTEAVERGVARQALPHELRQKIEIVRCDFSGAERARLFERLESAVMRQASADELARELTAILSEMRPEPSPYGMFELVLSCPVYTQLVYTQIEVLLKILYASGTYDYGELNRILIAAHRGMKRVLRGYNELMLSLLSPCGRLTVLSDIMELQPDDPRLCILAEQNAKDCIDASLMQSLIEEQGNELAINALEELESNLESPEIHHFIWPFNDEKRFVVKSLSGRIREIKR
ncbi:MAG: hypothetical protein C0413_00445 [Clostridiales bacterium]|nr:hypothetical protein [Clostridiales bacterium]